MDIELIEITEEELATLIKNREDEARRLIAVEALEGIEELLTTIHSLGYHVRFTTIGGSYVRKHNPEVLGDKLMLTKW